MVGLGLPAAAVGLLVAEALLARQGPRLAPRTLEYPGEAEVTAVWLGDSTAVGVGAETGDGTVATMVARARGERVVMLAESGATVGEVLDDQLAGVAAHDPDVVYVSVGANDVTGLTSAEDFRRDYSRLLDALAGPGARAAPQSGEHRAGAAPQSGEHSLRVVALGVPDMGAPPRLRQPLRALAGLRGRQLDGVIREVTRAYPNVTYVDIAGPTGGPFRRHPRRYFSPDHYHPSAAGYDLWADAVLATAGR
ncbi:MAG: SGNH/GDSL hydrolase family protein [Actinobacteria bacterium]|nr:SGNH/GDSL hydrolase family protein [Actinomycetota bacterium]